MPSSGRLQGGGHRSGQAVPAGPGVADGECEVRQTGTDRPYTLLRRRVKRA
jgi:hypothetical protein